MNLVDYYIRQFRRGDREGAFFGLLETGDEATPELTAAFHAEPDGKVRAFLLRVIRNRKESPTAAFFGEALCDPEPDVWKEALDGLVSLASQAALDVLRSAKDQDLSGRGNASEFQSWIGEAIEQIATEIQGVAAERPDGQ